MNTLRTELTFKKLFIFWLPLAATWLMMSFEGPFLAALIARMADPKFNLAAYGVAFSFALIIEAPVIMIMSAATALVNDRDSFIKLRNFTYTLNGMFTLVMLIFIIPTIFYFFAMDLIGLPQNVADLTHTATIILLPWPGAIGYRRFYQGVLIRNNLTRRVAYGTIIRLLFMTITATILYVYFSLDGVVVGASALSIGVIAEGIAGKLMALGVLKKIKNEASSDRNKEKLNYKGIFKFYYPLALTSFLALGVHPMVTFFMGQSRMAIESLAILPVINSLVFIFRSVGLSFQEVVIAKMGEHNEGYKPLRKFATIMGCCVVAGLALIAFTPLSTIWFHEVSGLSLELTNFAKLPLMIVAVIPGLTFLISFQRAVLVHARNTKPITFGTVSEVIGIIIVLFISIKLLSAIGLIAAALAFVIGRVAANIYLFRPMLKAVKMK